MLSGVNHNIDGENPIKYEVLCSLVKPNIGFLIMSSQEVYMIDGANPEIERVNHDIDGAKCQVFESSQVKYSLF